MSIKEKNSLSRFANSLSWVVKKAIIVVPRNKNSPIGMIFPD